MVEHAGNSAKRIRIGLTGLAFAFVIVLLGSAISRSGEDSGGNLITQATVGEPSEPLAELGVAPGANDDTNSSNAAQQ